MSKGETSMKKIGLLFATIIMVMLFVVSASATTYSGEFGVEGNNLQWKLQGETLTIFGQGEMTSGYGWSEESWYPYRSSINKIVIEEGISNLETYTFYELDNVEEISIPNTVTTISDKAISNCDNLKLIIIAPSVEKIESPMYHACNKVEKIVVSKDNQWFCNDNDGALFDIDKTILYHYPSSNKVVSYEVPGTVRRIGYNAFYGNKYIKSVSIPDEVSVIDNWAFMFCESLEEINIPKNLKKITGQCFDCCYALKEIVLPEGLTEIDYYGFADCTSLTEIRIPASVTKIANNSFNSCIGVEYVEVDTSNAIYYSVDNCIIDSSTKTLIRGFKNSVIPTDGSVEHIGYSAFSGIRGIKNITIPNTVTSIGYYAFNRCSDLVSIEIPDSVISLGYGAFDYCSRLKTATIGEGITTIEQLTFCSCYNLSNIIIPDTVTKIEKNAFYHCNPDHIAYFGNETQWKNIEVDDSNSIINTPEKLHLNFNSEADITETINASTCLSEGSKVSICSCGYLYESEELPIVECLFITYISDGNATCILDGTKTAFCNYGCGNSNTVNDIGSAKGHFYTSETTKEATHLAEGTLTFTCECGDTYDEPIAKLEGHTYTSEVTKEATHLAKGTLTYTCECGDTYDEPIAKLEEHNYIPNVILPTCSKNGYTEHICECGDSYVSDYVGMIAHSYAYSIIKLSTHISEGLGRYTCSECGDHYDEPIAKTKEHNYIATMVDSTCTDQGYTLNECECGESYKNNYLAKIDHVDSNSDGVCDDCGYDLAENCSCNCHKGGIAGFFFKLILFFQKLFRTNQICEGCGVYHY